MHYRFIRDSFYGRIVYHFSKHKYFKHPEEEPNFVIPSDLLPLPKEYDQKYSVADAEIILTNWNGTDDPENPYNWPLYQKAFFIFEIALLTTIVYMGAAIYTPGIDLIMEEFNISETVAMLPLSLFVIGYGIGPLIFSPMSENAVIGRTYVYILTLFIFSILQIPTALARDIYSLCILRFFSGIFASPCLGTGPASIGDVVSLPYIPTRLSLWSIAVMCGPSVGPIAGSILVVKSDWRWTFWIMLITSGIMLIVLILFLPETYGKTLLYRRAQRLRALTGNENITSEGEIENTRLTLCGLIIDSLWRPIQISLLEPMVLSINLYLSLAYSIVYLWFEAFPIFFQDMRGFSKIELGFTYLSTVVGGILGAFLYIPISQRTFTSKMLANKDMTPEVFLPSAIYGSFIMPFGLFIFGWTATTDIHWIFPLIGATLFSFGCFFIFQALYSYLSMSFWRFLASVFAGNDLFRSVMAGCFPLFARALYKVHSIKTHPVAIGSTILGAICVAMILIPVTFYLKGPQLRATSKYSGQ